MSIETGDTTMLLSFIYVCIITGINCKLQACFIFCVPVSPVVSELDQYVPSSSVQNLQYSHKHMINNRSAPIMLWP